jgi:quercetin dioxygenase-like cupin family protein
MVKHMRWSEIAREPVNELIERQYVSTERVTLARFELRKGAVVPQHRHENEQVTQVLEGRLKVTQYAAGSEAGEKEILLGAGDILSISPNVPHRVEALEDTTAFDVFAPARTDWAAGTDSYFRRQG